MRSPAVFLGLSLPMLFVQIDAYIALSNGIGVMLCRNESLWSEIDKDNDGTASVDEMTKFALATGVHDVLLKLERTDPNYYGIGLGEDGRKNFYKIPICNANMFDQSNNNGIMEEKDFLKLKQLFCRREFDPFEKREIFYMERFCRFGNVWKYIITSDTDKNKDGKVSKAEFVPAEYVTEKEKKLYEDTWAIKDCNKDGYQDEWEYLMVKDTFCGQLKGSADQEKK